MKQKQMTKKLTFNKETISNLELEKAIGGKLTMDYSQCGTGPATIVPCMCDGGGTLIFC
jgi:hypothetical protein